MKGLPLVVLVHLQDWSCYYFQRPYDIVLVLLLSVDLFGERINGIGGTLSILTIDRVTGTMSRMVITLSMNIEATAVKVDNNNISFQRFPLLRLVAFIPTQ